MSCAVEVDENEEKAYLRLETDSKALIKVLSTNGKHNIEHQPCTDKDVRVPFLKGVIIFGEKLFRDESHFSYLAEPQKIVRIPFKPIKDERAETLVKVIMGDSGGQLYTVVEQDPQIPKFLMYSETQENIPETISQVMFVANERVSRLCLWLSDRFCIKPFHQNPDEQVVKNFRSLRDGKHLQLRFIPAHMTCKVCTLCCIQFTVHSTTGLFPCLDNQQSAKQYNPMTARIPLLQH